jgi:hypothetical protein
MAAMSRTGSRLGWHMRTMHVAMGELRWLPRALRMTIGKGKLQVLTHCSHFQAHLQQPGNFRRFPRHRLGGASWRCPRILPFGEHLR